MAQIPAASPPPAFLTRRALARRWAMSVSTIKRREGEGLLTPRRELGKNVRYAMGEVLAVEGDQK